MADLNIKVEGLDRLKKAFSQAPTISEPILQRGIDAIHAILARNTLKDDPVPWRTGNLTQSFRFQTGRLYGRWYPIAHYARYVHDGHKQQAGRYVPAIGRRLKSPYVKGNPFMEKILNKAQAQIDKQIEKTVEDVAKAIAQGI